VCVVGVCGVCVVCVCGVCDVCMCMYVCLCVCLCLSKVLPSSKFELSLGLVGMCNED